MRHDSEAGDIWRSRRERQKLRERESIRGKTASSFLTSRILQVDAAAASQATDISPFVTYSIWLNIATTQLSITSYSEI